MLINLEGLQKTEQFGQKIIKILDEVINFAKQLPRLTNLKLLKH